MAEQRERPILFSAPMVRAILAGTKTVTRRIAVFDLCEPGLNLAFSGLEAGLYHSANRNSGWVLRSRDGGGRWNDRTTPTLCPYGSRGDCLWVKESIRLVSTRQPDEPEHIADVAEYEADKEITSLDRWPWMRSRLSGMFMPRGLSRITLKVVDVRVERLYDITEEDAKREGVEPYEFSRRVYPSKLAAEVTTLSYREGFHSLWDAINGKRAPWSSNPWVWRVGFKREQP